MMRHWLVAMGALSLACSHPSMPAGHHRLAAQEARSARFVAGAARVDVTPPPGASMFGHGPGAGVGVGYWTRLWCRAFYFESEQAKQDGFAIVSCDLPNIGMLLHRRVAARSKIPAARLMLTATHTHAGPGHYTESENFGGVGSALFPGFDDEMVNFLARRIACSVDAARDAARPARLRWVSHEVWGLTRNRSLLPYLANDTPAAWPAPEETRKQGRAYEAIDPTLRVLQIQAVDSAGGPREEIGSLSFFAMHPTVIGNDNRFYGGDVHGVVARRVESEREPGSVHAILNTNEGDISPAWVLGTASEAIGIGEKLASEVLEALKVDSRGSSELPRSRAGWQNEPRLGVRYLEERLPEAPYFTDAVGTTQRLCPDAELGIGAVRGAKDHPSVIQGILPTAEPNADSEREGCQAPKRPFLGCVQKLAVGEGAFPEVVPLGLVRIDDTWISFVPAELTITAGHRVNQAVLEIARTGVEPSRTADAVVAGLANGYILYVATPQEYALQHYEGASTLYGPNTSTLLEERFRYLALHLAQPAVSEVPTGYTTAVVDRAESVEYTTGPPRERLWRSSQDVPLEELGQRRKADGICRIPSSSPPAFCARWIDGGPAAVALAGRVYVEVAGCSGAGCAPEATTINDRGVEFHTRIHDRVGDAWRWSTVFHPSVETWARLTAMDAPYIRVLGTGSVRSIDLPALAGATPCSAELLRSLCAAPW